MNQRDVFQPDRRHGNGDGEGQETQEEKALEARLEVMIDGALGFRVHFAELA